ncbi:hypothetical protein [Chryseobacterium sp.]|uniref:hypothetical protein n=1 Tax=Chryseobacterium sp. TaxID=1871047 RepID=UPI00289FAC5E|nr:hypothetical protein [Chryseobacterium sp.]
MQKVLNKSFFAMSMVLLISCKKPNIYFNVQSQELIECSDFGLKQVSIDNDSVNAKGFSVEPPILLNWNSSKNVPTKISFDNLDKRYKIIQDNQPLHNLKLMQHSRYKISYHVMAKQDYEITVWTDDGGKIYKSTRQKCN